MTGSCGKCIFHFWGTTTLHPELLSHSAFLLTVQKVQQQHLSTNKTVQRSIWLVQECHSVCRTKVVFIVSWLFDCLLFIKMLNLDFGISGVEAPLTITGGHWVSLVLLSSVVRRQFMPPKQQGTQSCHFWFRMNVGPSLSRQLGGHSSLMLWLSWARVCASHQMSSLSAPDQSSYSMSLCKQWNRKCPGFRILGGKKCSLSALISKPQNESLHPCQKEEGIMIICPVLQGKGEKRWNVVSAKSDKPGWLISIQKSAFLSIQLIPVKHLWCARLCVGSFSFSRGSRLGFLDSSAGLTIQLT